MEHMLDERRQYGKYLNDRNWPTGGNLMAHVAQESLGADRHERSDERQGYRNGYRARTLELAAVILRRVVQAARIRTLVRNANPPLLVAPAAISWWLFSHY